MITAIDANTALVLIDLQKGITSMPAAEVVEPVIEKSVALLAAFRSRKLPVVIVNVNPLGAKWTQARVESSTAPKGEEAIAQARTMMEQNGFFEIIPQIEVRADDIRITKNTWNAFFNTPLHDSLQRLGITGIVLAGVATSIGVEGTARAASELGYNITFAQDAMADLKPDAHVNSLKNIFPRIGEVDNTEAIINMLAQTR